MEPRELPTWWRRFRSMDWGYNDPCCVLWHAVDDKGRIYTYRELYLRQTLGSEVASRIRVLSQGEEIAYTVASPDMWQKRGALLKSEGAFEGESLAEVFACAGVPLTPADNSRIAGWQQVRAFLANGPEGAPRWQVFSDCRNLIRTLPLLQYDQHNREDAADGEDHAPEALRYALMSRPARPLLPKESRPPSYDPFSVSKPRQGFLEIG